MEGSRMERKAKSSRDRTKPEELVHWKRPKNFLQSLMHREIGMGTGRQASTKDFEPLAEESLVKKEFKERKFNLPGVPRATYLMVYSPDGTKIASTHGNHSIYVTDIATGKSIKTLSGHPRTPWCIAFHPMFNNILASGCLAGQVRIWDLNGGCEIWDGVCETVIASLAFHPTERLLVFATHKSLHFWEWRKPKSSATKTTLGPDRIRYVAFDKSGTKLITGIENSPKGFRQRPNDNMAYLPIVRLNTIERFRNTHYSVREFARDLAHQNDNSGRNIAAQRRNSNNNDDDAEDRRYSDYIDRLLRFRNLRTGVVNIEVRRNTFGGPYEDEASGDGRPNVINSTFRSPRIDAADTRNESEPRQAQSTSDTESSRVESPSLVSPGVPFSSLSTPSTSGSAGSSYLNQRGSNLGDQRPDILAAVWPRRRNEPPHPPPPVPVRAFVPPSPSSPIPSPLWPLSRSTGPNFGASTSFSTPVASTSNLAPTSKSPANQEDNEESKVDDSRQNISDYDKAYNELIDSCEEAVRLIGGDFKTNKKNDGEQGKFRTFGAFDDNNARETTMSETTSSNNHPKTVRRRLEQNNARDFTTDGNESPLKKRIHDDSRDGTPSYRIADAGESSASSARARTSSEEETGQEVSRRMAPASTNLPSTSGFTVSSRSAFQPQQPRLQGHWLDFETPFSNYGRKETREIFGRDNARIFEKHLRLKSPWERHEKTRIGKIHARPSNPSNHSNSATSEGLNKTVGAHDKNEETRVSSIGQGPDNQSTGQQTLENYADECKNNNDDAESNEKSGYWLLEENNDSDGNNTNVDESASTSANSGNSKSRWIPLQSARTGMDLANDETSARESQRDEEAPSRITVGRDSSIDRDRLSPVLINSMELDSTTLFPFSSLQMSRAKKRDEDKRKEAAAKVPTSSSSSLLSESSSIIERDNSRRSAGSAFGTASKTSDSSSSSTSTVSCTVDNASKYDLSLQGISDSIAPRECIRVLRCIVAPFLPSGKMESRDNLHELGLSWLLTPPRSDETDSSETFAQPTTSSSAGDPRYEYRIGKNRLNIIRLEKKCLADALVMWMHLANHIFSLYRTISLSWVKEYSPRNVAVLLDAMKLVSQETASLFDELKRATTEGTLPTNVLQIGCIFFWQRITSDLINSWGDSSPPVMAPVNNKSTASTASSTSSSSDESSSDSPMTSTLARRGEAITILGRAVDSFLNNITETGSANSPDINVSPANNDQPSTSDVVSIIEGNDEKVESRVNDGDGNLERTGNNEDESVNSASGDDALSKEDAPKRDKANSFVAKNNSTANATNVSRPNEEIASCSQPATSNHPDNANSGDQLTLKQYNDELDGYCEWLSGMLQPLENNETAGSFRDAKLRAPAGSSLAAISRLETRLELFTIIERFPIILRTMQRCYSDPFDRGGVQRNIFHKLLIILKSTSEITRKLLKYWELLLPVVKQEIRTSNDEERRNSETRNRERASSEGVQADDPFSPSAIAAGLWGVLGRLYNCRELYSYLRDNRLLPDLNLRAEPRSFLRQRSAGASNINDPTSRVHERRGFNVPVVQINNVPVNFNNSSTDSRNSRFRGFRELRNPDFGRLRRLTIDQRMRLLNRDVSGDPVQSTIERDPYSWLDQRISLAHRRIHALGSFPYGSGDNLETAGTGGVQQESGNESYDPELLDRLNISALNSSDDSKDYRIQAWDFSDDEIPCIKNTAKNIVVTNCKIYNDASVDISSDGKLLVCMGCLGQINIIEVHSLEWKTLGKILSVAIRHFDTHVSFSLSPTSRYLLVGWASRKNRHRMFRIVDDTESTLSRPKLASIYELKHLTPNHEAEDKGAISKMTDDGSTASSMRPRRGDNEGRAEVEEREKETRRDEDDGNDEDDDDDNENDNDANVGGTDRACRNRQRSRRSNFNDAPRMWMMPVAREVVAFKSETDSDGINCIRWAPKSGQGIVYGTNTGQLNIFH